jgi:hypothetical protein
MHTRKGEENFGEVGLATRPLTPSLSPEEGERESRGERLNSFTRSKARDPVPPDYVWAAALCNYLARRLPCAPLSRCTTL